MNIHTVDPQQLYRAQTQMWNWLASLFSPTPTETTPEQKAPEQPAQEEFFNASAAAYNNNEVCINASQELNELTGKQASFLPARSWTYGKE